MDDEKIEEAINALADALTEVITALDDVDDVLAVQLSDKTRRAIRSVNDAIAAVAQ